MLASLSILLYLLAGGCSAYRHVIYMHGLFGAQLEFNQVQVYISKFHPGTNVTVIDDFSYFNSFTPLWTQIDQLRPKVEQIMKEHPDGVHLVCYSQGGLICRGLILTLPTHNVISFVSLSSPQSGQYGDSSYLAPFLPAFLIQDFYKIAYSESGQKLSVANFWNDPHHQDLYRKWSSFVAIVNNQTTTSNHTHNFSPAFKQSFVRLKNLVLVGGPDDGVISPWQSSQFGFYNSAEEVIGYQQQEFYLRDWFGLQTLDKRGSLHTCTLPGVQHLFWHKSLAVFKQCIEPWLT